RQIAAGAARVRQGPLDTAELAAVADGFERRYAELYGEGSGFSAAGIQAITYRVRRVGGLPFSPKRPAPPPAGSPAPAAARIGTRPVRFGGPTFVDTAIYDYGKLRTGHVITGPAVI